MFCCNFYLNNTNIFHTKKTDSGQFSGFAVIWSIEVLQTQYQWVLNSRWRADQAGFCQPLVMLSKVYQPLSNVQPNPNALNRGWMRPCNRDFIWSPKLILSENSVTRGQPRLHLGLQAAMLTLPWGHMISLCLITSGYYFLQVESVFDSYFCPSIVFPRVFENSKSV